MNLFFYGGKIIILNRIMRKALSFSVLIWSLAVADAFSQKPFMRHGWKTIGTEEGTFLIDKKPFVTNVSIHMKLYNPDQNDTKVWIKRYQQKIRFKRNGKETTTKGTTLTLYDTNCKEKKLAIREVIYYGDNDIIVKSIQFNDYETEWNFVVPESIGETILEAACELL